MADELLVRPFTKQNSNDSCSPELTEKVASVMPLEYEFGDEESQAFFDSVPFKRRNDKEYVRVHLGRNSCRRRGAPP